MKPGFARNAINSFLDKECIIDLIEYSIGNIMETTTDNDPSSIELENLMSAGATIRTDGGEEIEYVDRSLFGKNDRCIFWTWTNLSSSISSYEVTQLLFLEHNISP